MIRGVAESPVWLERQRHLEREQKSDRLSLVGLFAPDVIRTTIHTSLLMGAFLFMYHSITYWYPTLLGKMHKAPLTFLLPFNVGAILGALLFGRMSETALGRRGAASVATLVGVAVIPLYVFTTNDALLWIGSLAMGLFGAGNFGIVPAYLTERFPTIARAAGAGFAYHVGAGVASFTPTLVGALQDRGFGLPNAMATCIAASGIVLVVLIWLGPETRGREFHAMEERT
jgi:SHS family lactate transporter-like MFS transporter